MQVWDNVLQALKAGIPANSFKNWILPLKPLSLENGVANFEVPTTFIGNYVQQNFGDQIIYQLSKHQQDVQRLNFAVPARSTAAPAKVAPKAAANEGSPIDARFTFDNFVVGKPNELANAAARRVAEGGPVTFNPLFLYGGVGLGRW